MINEIWKDIEGYEGLYRVSDKGRVRSINRTDRIGRFKKGIILKQCYDGRKNYLHVTLCKNGKLKSVQVHTLVAQAFVDNSLGYKEINHIDENKTNNSAQNLEWCTRSYNNCFGSRKSSWCGQNNPRSKLSIEEVRQIRLKRKSGYKLEVIASEYDISISHVSNICHNKKRVLC
mgnify:CR=1 FL=1